MFIQLDESLALCEEAPLSLLFRILTEPVVNLQLSSNPNIAFDMQCLGRLLSPNANFAITSVHHL